MMILFFQEKAYAKLNTCYEFLDGGDDIDALTDMTGGVHERFKINKKDPNFDKTKLWEIIFKSFRMRSLSGTSIDVNENSNIEDEKPNGLVYGHGNNRKIQFKIALFGNQTFFF